MTYNIAILGLGKIAVDQHVPSILGNGDFKLVATISRSAGLAGVPQFKSIEALIASGLKVDALSICTPPAVRLQLCQQAFAAGFDVLIEKPPAPTLGEAQAIVAASAFAKRLLFVTWHSRFNAAVAEAKHRLKAKTISKLNITWREDVRKWHPGQEWIWQPGGFGVFDPGINALSIVTEIMPHPIFVDQATIEVPANKATAIAAQIIFKTGDGRKADLTADFDWRQQGEQIWDITVETDDGETLNLKRGGSALYVGETLIVEEQAEEYQRIYQCFAELLKARRPLTDLSPLQLLSDCLMLARPVVTDVFN